MHQLQESRRAKVDTPPIQAPREHSEPGGQAANKLVLTLTLVLTLIADQVSKAWALNALSGGRHLSVAGDVLELRLVRNSGSAFGLFARFPLVIFLLNLGIMAIVVVWAWRTPQAGIAFGLVLGGGLGNLADRLFREPGMGLGEVVDFIYLSFWPTFNLADSAIVTGVALLMLDGLRERGE